MSLSLDRVTTELEEIVVAMRRLAAVGLPVQVPAALREACMAVLLLDTDSTELGELERAVPLRRRIWQVVAPGQTVTVAEVVERLAELGRTEDAAAVSNTLGYWAGLGQLERVKRGVYRRPRSQ